MTVFTLPSYPYVFKLIKDVIPHPKDTDRSQVMAKYRLVKLHDRVGRMADTWEYSQVTLPRSRFSPALLRELLSDCASIVELDDETVLIQHVYIERRMKPLNIYLMHATDDELDHAIFEYGNAIRELAAANIFPGDMLYKNFGVTRLNRVVFYDYDEIEYIPGLSSFAACRKPDTPKKKCRARRGTRSTSATCFPKTGACSCSEIIAFAQHSFGTMAICSRRTSGMRASNVSRPDSWRDVFPTRYAAIRERDLPARHASKSGFCNSV